MEYREDRNKEILWTSRCFISMSSGRCRDKNILHRWRNIFESQFSIHALAILNTEFQPDKYQSEAGEWPTHHCYDFSTAQAKNSAFSHSSKVGVSSLTLRSVGRDHWKIGNVVFPMDWGHCSETRISFSCPQHMKQISTSHFVINVCSSGSPRRNVNVQLSKVR